MGWAGVICAQWAQITPVKASTVSILHRQKEPHQPSKHKELLEYKSHSVLHLLALNLLAEEGRIRIHLQRLIFSLPSHFGSEAPLYSTKSGQIWQTQALFIGTLSSSSLFSSLCSSCVVERFSRQGDAKICSFTLLEPGVGREGARMDLNVAGGHKSLLRRYPHVLSPSFPAQNLLKCNGWEAQRLIFSA